METGTERGTRCLGTETESMETGMQWGARCLGIYKVLGTKYHETETDATATDS